MSGVQLVSVTTETNPNGIVVEKIINTDDEVIPGTREMYIYMLFKTNDPMYQIVVVGNETEQNR